MPYSYTSQISTTYHCWRQDSVLDGQLVLSNLALLLCCFIFLPFCSTFRLLLSVLLCSSLCPFLLKTKNPERQILEHHYTLLLLQIECLKNLLHYFKIYVSYCFNMLMFPHMYSPDWMCFFFSIENHRALSISLMCTSFFQIIEYVNLCCNIWTIQLNLILWHCTLAKTINIHLYLEMNIIRVIHNNRAITIYNYRSLLTWYWAKAQLDW